MTSRARVLTLLVLVASLGVAGSAHASLQGTPTVLQPDLQTPWEVAPTPDGRMFITERDAARVRVVLPSGALREDAALQGQSPYQFLGLALHPGFAANRLVYLFQRYDDNGDMKTRVVRLRDDGTRLVDQTTVFDGIPSGDNHDGGRIAFGPDGKLYVTTGDQHDPDAPQDLGNLNGKILRMEAPGDGRDGDAPGDNPFYDPSQPDGARSFVWSYGHRHPQGIAWDAQGRLWSTEHGPSGDGADCCRDELNLIVKGGNYGWPTIRGGQTASGMQTPVVHSGDTTTWAPGDLAFGEDGILYAPALRGAHLHAFELSGSSVTRHYELYKSTYGRLRVAVPHAGRLLFAQDGSGADLLSVAFSPNPAPGSAATPPAGTEPTPGATTTTSPPLVGPTPPAADRTTAAVLDRLLGRARTSLLRTGLRRLLRRGSLAARVGGLPRGRVVLRAELRRPGRRALTVAVGSAAVRSRSVVTVRARLTRSGRAALRRTRRGRIFLRATHIAPRGPRVARTAAPIALRRST